MSAPKRPALERAAELIQGVRDDHCPIVPSPAEELRGIDTDVLTELALELAEEKRAKR